MFVFNCEHFFAYFWKARGSRGDAAAVNRGGKRKERLGSRPLSQDVIALEKSAKARRLRQDARRACYPGEELGTSVSRSGTSNTEHPTSNEEERRAVTRGRRRGRRGAEE